MNIAIPVALSAFSLGLYDVARKHAVRENSAVDVLLWSSVAGLAAFLAVAGCGGTLADAARATAHQRLLLSI